MEGTSKLWGPARGRWTGSSSAPSACCRNQGAAIVFSKSRSLFFLNSSGTWRFRPLEDPSSTYLFRSGRVGVARGSCTLRKGMGGSLLLHRQTKESYSCLWL